MGRSALQRHSLVVILQALCALATALAQQEPAVAQTPKCKTNLGQLVSALDSSGALRQEYDANDSDLCALDGVQCNSNWEPTAIQLPSRGLQGELPSDNKVYECLPYLRTLDLSDNQLGYGVVGIPAQVGTILRLESLDLSKNQFVGALPSIITSSDPSVVHPIRFIDLSYNQLSGPLRWNWYVLENLEFINLENNQLTGDIPNSWYTTVDGELGLPNVEIIILSGNDANLCGGSVGYGADALRLRKPPVAIACKADATDRFTPGLPDEEGNIIPGIVGYVFGAAPGPALGPMPAPTDLDALFGNLTLPNGEAITEDKRADCLLSNEGCYPSCEAVDQAALCIAPHDLRGVLAGSTVFPLYFEGETQERMAEREPDVLRELTSAIGANVNIVTWRVVNASESGPAPQAGEQAARKEAGGAPGTAAAPALGRRLKQETTEEAGGAVGVIGIFSTEAVDNQKLADLLVAYNGLNMPGFDNEGGLVAGRQGCPSCDEERSAWIWILGIVAGALLILLLAALCVVFLQRRKLNSALRQKSGLKRTLSTASSGVTPKKGPYAYDPKSPSTPSPGPPSPPAHIDSAAPAGPAPAPDASGGVTRSISAERLANAGGFGSTMIMDSRGQSQSLPIAQHGQGTTMPSGSSSGSSGPAAGSGANGDADTVALGATSRLGGGSGSGPHGRNSFSREFSDGVDISLALDQIRGNSGGSGGNGASGGSPPPVSPNTGSPAIAEASTSSGMARVASKGRALPSIAEQYEESEKLTASGSVGLTTSDAAIARSPGDAGDAGAAGAAGAGGGLASAAKAAGTAAAGVAVAGAAVTGIAVAGAAAAGAAAWSALSPKSKDKEKGERERDSLGHASSFPVNDELLDSHNARSREGVHDPAGDVSIVSWGSHNGSPPGSPRSDRGMTKMLANMTDTMQSDDPHMDPMEGRTSARLFGSKGGGDSDILGGRPSWFNGHKSSGLDSLVHNDHHVSFSSSGKMHTSDEPGFSTSSSKEKAREQQKAMMTTGGSSHARRAADVLGHATEMTGEPSHRGMSSIPHDELDTAVMNSMPQAPYDSPHEDSEHLGDYFQANLYTGSKGSNGNQTGSSNGSAGQNAHTFDLHSKQSASREGLRPGNSSASGPGRRESGAESYSGVHSGSTGANSGRRSSANTSSPGVTHRLQPPNQLLEMMHRKSEERRLHQ